MGANRVIGILAHVDAGKTTLSEQLLWHAGVLRAPGRVDHGSAFLDAHPMERQRGITIFSDQAVFERDGQRYFWLDTPGHVDFTAEMERAVTAMDYAVLVINGAEGLQSHTHTIWNLLKDYGVPTFLFINKTDRAGCDVEKVRADIRARLSADAVDLRLWHGGALPESVKEAAAERDEALFDRLLSGDGDDAAFVNGLRGQIRRRELFPIYAGSALNDVGVSEFMDALCLLTLPFESKGDDFSARVYKVRRDHQGGRVCFFKVLSGSAAVRDEVTLPGGDTAKLSELRVYSGAKYQPISVAEPGMLCAAPGLVGLKSGDGLGAFAGHPRPFHTEPMMAASVLPDKSIPLNRALEALRALEEEDPTLRVNYREATQALEIHVMGKIQLEVLRQLMLERFAIPVTFGPMRVLYMETITTPAVGVGHYEPLRHYAEVQLRLVPGARGSGITFESLCHVDELALNWQRLIETHVFEKTHRGVLTGAPLTDVKVQLLHGRAHLKHTEGGDFRESTYRAIRNALMHANCQLLEPICRFSLRAPREAYGRVMGDLNRMQADCDPPLMDEAGFTLTGTVPVAEFAAYSDDFLAVTHGQGSLNYRPDHYAPCRDAQAIVEAAHYNPLAEDTPDSVFCAHGAGYVVPWQEVRTHAHCPVEPD